MNRFCVFVFVAAFSIHSQAASQQVLHINSATELRKAFQGSLEPGTTLELRSGQFDLQGVLIIEKGGSEGLPILIRAEQTGKTEFVRDSRIHVRSTAYVELEGFEFSTELGPAVMIDGSHDVRITRNTFHLIESSRSSWVIITGASHHNRIDHNLFEKKKVLGNFITVEGTPTGTPQVSQYDVIDHNHFRDIGPRVENVLEAIRVGSSEYSLSSGYTVVEYNLFERCDGDPEYISVKSSDNMIRYNTFRECLGSLSLRHGNRNRVEGNFILGNGRTGTFLDSTGRRWTLGTGGVRFYGDSMVIINNYFEGLTGRNWDATMAITNGNADYGEGLPLTKHYRIRDALIAFNTMVNNTSNIEIGYDGGGFQNNWWDRPPRGLIIANNIIVGSVGVLVKVMTSPEQSKCVGNIVFAKNGAMVSKGEIPGVKVVDPKLVREKGMWRLQVRSSARGKGEGEFPWITEDIEGQQRIGHRDVGADEFSRDPVKRGPLSAQDVGPLAK